MSFDSPVVEMKFSKFHFSNYVKTKERHEFHDNEYSNPTEAKCLIDPMLRLV